MPSGQRSRAAVRLRKGVPPHASMGDLKFVRAWPRVKVVGVRRGNEGGVLVGKFSLAVSVPPTCPPVSADAETAASACAPAVAGLGGHATQRANHAVR